MIRRLLLFALGLALAGPAISGPAERREDGRPDIVALQRGWGWTMCSGAMVGPGLVLTAASCVYDQGARKPRSDLTVVPGLHNHGRADGPDPKPSSRLFVYRIHLPLELGRRIERFGYASSRIQTRYVAPLDIALLEVASPGTSHGSDRNYRKVGDITGTVAALDPTAPAIALGFAGYATDRHPDTQFEAACEGLEFDGRLISTKCLSGRSMAGGPLWRKSDGAIIGVNYGSQLDEETDRRIAGSFVPIREYFAAAIRALATGLPVPVDALSSYEIDPDPFIGIDGWNRCDRPVGIALRHLDQEGEWNVGGFWDVEPGEFLTLPVKTTNSVVYWTGYRHGDSYFHWRGNAYQTKYRGAELDMIRVEGSDHWHDIRLTLECPPDNQGTD